MLFEIILLLLAIPTGLLIAYLTPEELKSGQPFFKAIITLSVLTGIWFFIQGQNHITWTAGFIAIATFFSLRKY